MRKYIYGSIGGSAREEKKLYAFSHGFTTRLINAGIDVNNNVPGTDLFRTTR